MESKKDNSITGSIADNWKNRHLIKKCRRIDELKLEIQIAELENKLREVKDGGTGELDTLRSFKP